MYQPLSYIHPGAKIAKNVVIEPFSSIDKNVVIGEGSWIGSNVTIMSGARIGKNVSIFPGSVISAVPQDLKFKGEETTAEIGDNTTLRECVTINRGTSDRNKTKIGKDWANFGPENALEHIKEYTNFYGQRQSLRIPTPKGKVQVDLPKDKVVKEESRYSELAKPSPEGLIKIIKRKSSSPAQIKAAEDALVPQYEALAVEALKYTEAKGDIIRKNVISANIN